MNLVYYQPWSLMDHWQREVEQNFNRRLDAPQTSVTNTVWTPPVDLQEESDRFVLRADVPGVALKDIEVSAEDGTLTIRGERLAREQVNSAGLEHLERAAGTFLRTAAVAAIDGQLIRVVHAQGGRDGQPYLPLFIAYYLGGMGSRPLVTVGWRGK